MLGAFLVCLCESEYLEEASPATVPVHALNAPPSFFEEGGMPQRVGGDRVTEIEELSPNELALFSGASWKFWRWSVF